MDGRIGEWMNGLMDGWIGSWNGWDGWVDERMGWMNGWMK